MPLFSFCLPRHRRVRAAITFFTFCAALFASGNRVSPAFVPTLYGPVVLSARVADRRDRPVPGVWVRFAAQLEGTSNVNDRPMPVQQSVTLNAQTDANGVASVPVGRGNWFRGRVHFTLTPVIAPQMPPTQAIGGDNARLTKPEPATGEALRPLASVPLQESFQVPGEPGGRDRASWPASGPTLRVYDRPDCYIDGFPVWTGTGGKLTRMVVLLEVFDLYNVYSATDNLRLIESDADRQKLRGVDRLRAAGISVLVVNYPDAHLAPDTLAPLAARAIRAASHAASGNRVTVAGISTGGIVGRWALCEAEKNNAPLPVNLLLLLDSPNRGANINPFLMAIALRYGTDADREAMRSPASRALLDEPVCDISQADWERVGIGTGLLSRQVPVRVRPDTREHESFFARLRAMGRNGYPRTCRVAALANSGRRGGGGGPHLMHLWLPGNQFWNLPASPADRAPGSLLPQFFVRSFRRSEYNHAGGAYLPDAPTFVSAASALDADVNETPPFDAFFALPDNAPPRGHDDVASGAAAFVVREVLAAQSENMQTTPSATAP